MIVEREKEVYDCELKRIEASVLQEIIRVQYRLTLSRISRYIQQERGLLRFASDASFKGQSHYED